jgi:hypothetical protein
LCWRQQMRQQILVRAKYYWKKMHTATVSTSVHLPTYHCHW